MFFDVVCRHFFESIFKRNIMKLKRLILLLCVSLIGFPLFAQNIVKVGIIGLDTSHSPAFVKILNGENDDPVYAGYKIVAAYPYGSTRIESSAKRIPGYIEEVKKYDVKIVESIAELLKQVDCVLLETNDGNLHLEQAVEVLKTGKPMFIDKPVAATLVDAIAIFELAKKYNTPVFSSSALRFVPKNMALRNGDFGKVLGADAYSPAPGEPSHPDFSWYGIHGVETLFTVMGVGCKEVSRVSSEGTDVVVGLWDDGRIGSFRGIRAGKQGYGGSAFCEKENTEIGGYDGYGHLLKEIITFFKTKNPPVSEKETIEIFTFMEASNQSKAQGGKAISMETVYQTALKQALKLVESKK